MQDGWLLVLRLASGRFFYAEKVGNEGYYLNEYAPSGMVHVALEETDDNRVRPFVDTLVAHPQIKELLNSASPGKLYGCIKRLGIHQESIVFTPIHDVSNDIVLPSLAACAEKVNLLMSDVWITGDKFPAHPADGHSLYGYKGTVMALASELLDIVRELPEEQLQLYQNSA